MGNEKEESSVTQALNLCELNMLLSGSYSSKPLSMVSLWCDFLNTAECRIFYSYPYSGISCNTLNKHLVLLLLSEDLGTT